MERGAATEVAHGGLVGPRPTDSSTLTIAGSLRNMVGKRRTSLLDLLSGCARSLERQGPSRRTTHQGRTRTADVPGTVTFSWPTLLRATSQSHQRLLLLPLSRILSAQRMYRPDGGVPFGDECGAGALPSSLE